MRTRALLVMILMLLFGQILPSALAVPGHPLQVSHGAGPYWSSDRPVTRSVPQRWTVQLRTPALTRAAATTQRSLRSTTTSKLEVDALATQNYRSRLQDEQTSTFRALQQTFPQAQLHRRYDTLINGFGLMLLDADQTALARLRAMPNVAGVYPEQYYSPQLFGSVK
jgi:hypothetical protein